MIETPWIVVPRGSIEGCGILDRTGKIVIARGLAEVEARAIVDSVNACVGIRPGGIASAIVALKRAFARSCYRAHSTRRLWSAEDQAVHEAIGGALDGLGLRDA